jgi:hypothetical protein
MSSSQTENEDELGLDELFKDNIHYVHCKMCFNPSKCESQHLCKLVKCPQNCAHQFHECKLDEHLSETCSNSYVNCINHSNGCRLKIKRSQLGTHLHVCAANVIRCSSFTLRKVSNKNDHGSFRFPDPVYQDKNSICNNKKNEKEVAKREQLPSENIPELMLERDYENLTLFAQKNPLMFQRMYGYLIGLKLDESFAKQHKFGFLKYLLKNVKSKIFKDLEAENCVVYNDYDGCAACQQRIRNMEINRFNKLRQDYFNFGSLLKYTYTYDDFLEHKIYQNEEFLAVYHQFYPIPDDATLDFDLEDDQNVNKSEVFEQLSQNNKEILEIIKLDKSPKLNVAKELGCEAFMSQYESYRLLDTTFSFYCDKLFRRNEYSDHYSLVHNFIMPYMDVIYSQCPFADYGCTFFEKKYNFLYVKEFDPKSDWTDNPLSACLCYDKSFDSFGFSLRNNYVINTGKL